MKCWKHLELPPHLVADNVKNTTGYKCQEESCTLAHQLRHTEIHTCQHEIIKYTFQYFIICYTLPTYKTYNL